VSIPIKGINRTSPDKVSEDGNCQEIINARFVNQAWRPVGDKEELYTLGSLSNFDNIYKHPVLPDGYYVGSEIGAGGLCVIHDNTFEAQFLSFAVQAETVVLIDHLGTILRCVTEYNGSYYYYLCKYEASTDTYMRLRDLPRPRVEFLQDASASSPATAKTGSTMEEAEGYYYESVAGFNAEGYIEGNVLFRLAYKMIDGSYIHHSQPYHLYLGDAPLTNPIQITQPGGSDFKFTEMYFDRPKLRLKFAASDTLSGYEGIIVSLCVFMTRPVSHWHIGNYQYPPPVIEIQPKQNGGVSGLIADSGYYLVHEIAFDDLVTGTTSEYYPDLSDIANLVSKTALPVDNYSNHSIFGIRSLLFNNRLHMGNTTTILGDALDCFLWQAQGSVFSYTSFLPDLDVQQVTPFIFKVFLRTDQGEKVIQYEPDYIERFEDIGAGEHAYFLNSILSYPDDRAYKMEVWQFDGASTYELFYSYDLISHPFYNFSYYANYNSTVNTYRFIQILTTDSGTPGSPESESNKLEDTNRVQVSETNNIFVMPAGNSYRVDDKENIVLGLAAMGEPVSEGQFGVYPLYVFTSKGIWTMQQGSGLVLYQSIQPISREVCVNAASILSLGQSVLFATSDGLKVIASRNIEDISDPIEGKVSEHLTSHDDYETFLSNIFLVELFNKVTAIRFRNFLTTAIFAYDQVNREIIVSNPDDSSGSTSSDVYSYVFNLKTSTWHKISDTWDQFLNNYPGFIGINDTVLYDMSDEDTTIYPEVLIQTRPFKLEPGNKKILGLILRGYFVVKDETFVGLYLFGTQDNKTYNLLQGRQIDGEFDDYELNRSLVSAKSFIVVFAGQLSQDTEITHLDINYLPRFTRKMR